MTLREFAASSGFKNFTAIIYYWARAIVVLGIIFLINAWPGGGLIVSVGGGLLILIYFFVAFEPLDDEYDWTLAFPELAGFQNADELDQEALDNKLEKERIENLRTRIERLKYEVEKLS